MEGTRRPRRARLADVARAAGTSPPVASRILNDDPTLTVSAELRERVLATAHPSAVLRMPDEAARHEAMRQLVRDLAVVARALRENAAR